MIKATPTPPSPLNEEAHALIGDIARHWKAVRRAIHGGEQLDRAQDFARLVGVKTKLAWQFWRAMHASGPAEMLAHLPGEPGLRILWAALEAKPGARAATRALRTSLLRFRALARVHAGGDADALAGMLVQFEPGRRERLDLQHREAGFQAARNLWGVQAHTTLALSILHPGVAPHLMDVVALRATLGFQRLRHDVPWIIGRVGCRPQSQGGPDPEPSDEPHGPRRESIFPIKGGVGGGGTPSLIAELSSRPLPALRLIPRTPALADVELAPGPIGELAAMDLVVGDVFRDLPRFADSSRPDPEITPIVFTPSERYVHDLIVHDGAEPAGPFTVDVFGDPRCDGLENAATRQRLPVELRTSIVGRGPRSLALADAPNYREMVDTVHARLRWRSTDFTVHRVEWRFPVTPSLVRVLFRGYP